MRTIETERLILRPWRIDDLNDFFEYAKNPNVGLNAGWKPHKDKSITQKILNDYINNDDVWAIVYKEDNKVVGSISLNLDKYRWNKDARMIGYVLSEDYWGKGIVVEAVNEIIKFGFCKMDLDLISVYHFEFNVRSKKVIEKCGFKYEGTLRNAAKLYNNYIIDIVCYSMLKKEFKNKR